MPILEIIFLISILKTTEKCWTHYRYRCPLASNQTFPYCFLIQLTQANLPFLLICNWPGDQNERGESVHLPVRCLRIWWVTMSAIFKCLRLLIHKAATAMLFFSPILPGFPQPMLPQIGCWLGCKCVLSDYHCSIYNHCCIGKIWTTNTRSFKQRRSFCIIANINSSPLCQAVPAPAKLF